jgi:protein-disulfide isomerase
MARFDGDVQLILYPFVLNPTSDVATQAAWCAGEQGRFWDFHHMLYDRQAQWNRLSEPLTRLLTFAADLGLDTAALKRCVNSGRMRGLVEADKAYGRSLGVQSTPTLFINNQRLIGVQPEKELERVIQQELTRARRSTP